MPDTPVNPKTPPADQPAAAATPPTDQPAAAQPPADQSAPVTPPETPPPVAQAPPGIPAPVRRQQAQLFVSYSRSDRLAVDRLVKDLRRRHYRLWMDVDERGIEPGEEWAKELQKQITASEGVIACVSPDFLRSKYCRSEIEQAQQENKPIYPVIVRRLDQGQSLAEIKLDALQYVDLTLDYKEGVRRLRLVLPRPRIVWKRIGQQVGLAAAGIAALAVLLLIIVLGVKLGTSGTEATHLPPPTPTDATIKEDLGIAVAYFDISGLPDDRSAEADALVERFGLLLDKELSTALEPMRFTYGYRGPDIVGRISGENQVSQAQQIAAQYNADIVVYGVIEADSQGVLQIQPEFWTNPEKYADAWEMTGNYRFGSPIPVRNTVETEGQLSSRTQALTFVVEGLAQFLLVEDYDAALKSFEAAQNVPGWSELQGREVINIMLGNSYLRLAGRAASHCDRATVLENVDLAIQEFEEADQIAGGTYFRPYSGLAAAKFLQARWTLPESDQCAAEVYDMSTLQEALDDVQKANDTGGLMQTEPVIYVRLRMNEARIMWVMCGAEASSTISQETIDQACQQFQTLTEEVIRLYADRNDPTLAEDAALAYGLRGDIAQLYGDFDQAIDLYDQALAIPGIAPEQRMYFTGYQGDASYWMGKYQDALAYYTEAQSLAEELGYETEAQYYQDLVDTVKQELQDSH